MIITHLKNSDRGHFYITTIFNITSTHKNVNKMITGHLPKHQLILTG